MDLATLKKTLLANRGLTKEDEIEEFFHPTDPEKIESPFDSTPAIQLIKLHIEAGNKIIIFGDYDVDGICSVVILWETLYKDYKNVSPHLPHRETEGYGLTIKGIDHCLKKDAKLIIAVDNGIVAHKEIEYCKEKGCDIIIIDHHEPDDKIAQPNVLLHSTSTSAAGLAWLFCRDYSSANPEQLSLVSIAVICDMVPLVGLNRSFAKYGLQQLNQTKRPGVLALLNEAGITTGNLGTYEVGFIVGPRINAMGRLEHAIDSLRLICTNDVQKAQELATLLGRTNKERQDLTTAAVSHALAHVNLDNSVLIVADKSYPSGIIGLIASKLAEKYYKPAIAISIGDRESKASARSVSGFHITDHIRTVQDLLVGAGGHAMAAGFTVESAKLDQLIAALAKVEINPEILVRKQRVDAEIPVSAINYELYTMIQTFAPFGLGNPMPVFKSTNLNVDHVKYVGKEAQHAKLTIDGIEAMAFNTPIVPHSPVDLAYTVDKNTWNGREKLQLIVKEIKSSHG